LSELVIRPKLVLNTSFIGTHILKSSLRGVKSYYKVFLANIKSKVPHYLVLIITTILAVSISHSFVSGIRLKVVFSYYKTEEKHY